MIKVKKLIGNAGYHSFGPRYEIRIGQAQALALVGQLPKMGYRIDVEKSIHVANVCGQYFLRSVNATIEDWPECYGITVI